MLFSQSRRAAGKEEESISQRRQDEKTLKMKDKRLFLAEYAGDAEERKRFFMFLFALLRLCENILFFYLSFIFPLRLGVFARTF